MTLPARDASSNQPPDTASALRVAGMELPLAVLHADTPRALVDAVVAMLGAMPGCGNVRIDVPVGEGSTADPNPQPVAGLHVAGTSLSLPLAEGHVLSLDVAGDAEALLQAA
jgi:hypothetical protein